MRRPHYISLMDIDTAQHVLLSGSVHDTRFPRFIVRRRFMFFVPRICLMSLLGQNVHREANYSFGLSLMTRC